MNLVSIVIPMFNELNNIEQCVEVLKQQKSQKFDVLFIDDGSTDGTATYLESILNKEMGFEYKIITQKNRGAAEARRVGIERSETEFVMIFDCDDKLSSDLVDELYNTYKKYNRADIIIPKMSIQDRYSNWKEIDFYTVTKELKPIDCVKNSLDKWQVHGCFAIRKTVIMKSYKQYSAYNIGNNNYVNNDEVITRFNFSNSKNIIRCNAEYYYYFNTNSTTKRINSKKYLSITNALILFDYYKNDERVKKELYGEVIAVLWGTLLYMNKNKKELNNINDWKIGIDKGVKKICFSNIFKDISIKSKIQLTILKAVTLL